MKVQLSRTGGIAGITMSAAVEAAELPAEHQQIVGELIRDEIASVEDQKTAHPANLGADRFTYQLDVDDGHRTRNFNWVDPQIPDQVRPLLDTLMKRAHPS